MISGGWKLLLNSKKAHYFVGGRSLCGRWMYLGPDSALENDNHNSPDNCPTCMKKRNHEAAKDVAHA